jgi:DNA-3-methyladenine glycosylase II
MRQIVDEIGPYRLCTNRDRFGMLIRSIVSQQISVSAARSIHARLKALVSPNPLTPTTLLQRTESELRAAGLSAQKVAYMRDLAIKVDGGAVPLHSIGRRSDEEVIECLTQVHGVGRWTAQMFLIFALGRPDVLPDGDLGVRSAIRDRYGLAELPDKATCHQIASPWRPFASAASWYCWRSLEAARKSP